MEGVDLPFVDTLTYIPPAKLHEKEIGDLGVGVLERLAGHVRGVAKPDNANGRMIRFSGVSSQEANVPSSEVGTMRYVQDYFLSGGALRVYRDWPSTLTAWTDTNTDGYDDIVTYGQGTERTYKKHGEILTQMDFEFQGVAV